MSVMHKTVSSLAPLLLGVLLVTGCGTVPDQATAEGRSSSERNDEHDEPPDLEGPPPVTVRFSGGSIELEPWTYCYGTICADGMPPKNPPDVGDPDEIIVEFPLSGWSFDATFTPAGEKCGREFPAAVEENGDGQFVLQPAGYPDTYDVTLSGRGDGDLFTTFRWTTTSKGPLPRPTARLAVLADNDDVVDSYGVELMLAHLVRTPEDASATITVRASNGESITFQAKRTRGCWPEGTLYWDGPDAEGSAAAQLPGEHFTYEVEVRLDGERYSATAVWPEDVIPDNEPSVRLDFQPELPALE